MPNNMVGQMNQINPMINMQHMARNQPAPNAMFQGSKCTLELLP